MSPESPLLLEARGLVREFDLPGKRLFGPRQVLTAVSDVSFSIAKGEILGLVGESGSGKTTLGRLVMRLLDPTRGKVFFDGTDLTALSGRGLRRHRRRFQMVFQDPYASLNPRMRVGEIVEEPLIIHDLVPDKTSRRERVSGLLERVGLSRHDLERFPREFSGGGRQRVGIARAIACAPDLLVADEPIASLDLSIGAQIINLFSSLNEKEGMSVLFISHDLSVVRYISDRVAVLYRGRVVEVGPTREVLDDPVHPYTRLLMGRDAPMDAGETSDGQDRSFELCPFLARCPEARPACRERMPERFEEHESGRQVFCHLVMEGSTWKTSAPSPSRQGIA